ncbi:MAG: hypothetical protein HQM16_04100 [Deltaproteobacteria bacterium]|nr:hypothetical protein [Deltaproteobacteria bacterium]
MQAFGVALDATIVDRVTINVTVNTNPKVDGAKNIAAARIKEIRKKLVMDYHIESKEKNDNKLGFKVVLYPLPVTHNPL